MNKYYILAGWLIDGSGGPVKEHVLVQVANGIIAGLEPYNSSDRPAAALITDLSHCTVLPALIDSHVHLCLSGTTEMSWRKRQLTADYAEIKPVIAQHLRDHFAHGVFALRDAGDRTGATLQFRREQAGQQGPPVLLKLAGRAWHHDQRYGALIGRPPAGGMPLDQAYHREDEPVDQVKLVNSGLNSLQQYGRETAPQFSRDEIARVVRQAKRQGRSVMVHANGVEPVRAAIEAGCDSIEHGYFMGRENIALMAEKEICWVPTLVTMKALAAAATAGMIKADRQVIEKTLDHQLGQVAFARRAGVRLALGTDAGSIGVLHGEAVVQEMKLLMTAGYSLVEAIACATTTAARLLGLDHELGLLAAGKPAHFLVTRGTPAQLPRKLSYLEAIYHYGRPSQHYRR